MSKQTTNVGTIMHPDSLDARLIAPCGMNCGLCFGYVRKKNRCPGCNDIDPATAKFRSACRIANCAKRAEKEEIACYECPKFPCLRLRQLDKRYRTKYGMSMIENLASIREHGIDEFVTREKTRWKCPGCGGVISVHRPECIYCGRIRS